MESPARSRRWRRGHVSRRRPRHEPVAVRCRIGEEVTDRALPRRIVFSPVRMADTAQASRRRQSSDRGGSVARVAPLVRDVYGWMRSLWLGQRVTARAAPAGCVVVLVTILACHLRRARSQRHGRGVTIETRPLGVQLVTKLHRAGLRLMARNGNAHRHGSRRRVRLGAMTARALCRRRCGMMAGRAAEGAFELETAVRSPGLVAAQARQLLVRRMWEAVAANTHNLRRGSGVLRRSAKRRGVGEGKHQHNRADQAS
jgi:hypothetical protein